MPGVFINYRRQDALGVAGALVRDLEKQFDPAAVFMDVTDIPGGANFPRLLEDTIASCDVVLSLIGERWLDAVDKDGHRRLDQPGDFVRSEIECAMRHRVRIIPILLGKAEMPRREQLPPALETLADLNAMHLGDRDWERDVAALMDQVRKATFAGTADPAVPATFDAGKPNLRELWVITGVFGLFGVLFITLGVAFGISSALFVTRALQTQGAVVDLVEDDQQRLFPVIAFETAEGQGIRFTSPEGAKTAAHAVGDKVGVLYDPAVPEEAREKSFSELWGWLAAFGLMGGLFGTVGGVVLAVGIRRRRQWKRRLRLAGEGRPVMTAFRESILDANVSANGQHPFRVVTEWTNPVTGKSVLFRSEHVWKDPSELLRHRSIVVVIDPNNFDQYLVDLSRLPQDFKRPPGRVSGSSGLSRSVGFEIRYRRDR